MSDATPPPSDGSAPGGTPADPYGPPPTSPYGQPPAPYGGSGGQYPGGQYPSGQYGQPARDPFMPDYGQHALGAKRPGTVTAAAVTTLVLAGVTAAFTLLATIGLVVAKDDFLRRVQDGIDKQNSNTSLDASTLYGVFIVVLVVVVLWALGACLLAVLVLRRSNVARIMLVVSASITALLSQLAIASALSVVTLVGGIAVIVLLFTGSARAWFKGQGTPQAQQVPEQTIY